MVKQLALSVTAGEAWRQEGGASGSGRAYLSAKPSRKSIRRQIESIREKTAKRRTLLPAEQIVTELNDGLRGWANYFRHAVATRTFRHLAQFTWSRLVHWQRTLHRWRWKDVRRWLTGPNGRWRPITAGETTLFDPCSIPIRRYRYRGNAIPNPFTARPAPSPTAALVESPVR